MKDFVAVLNIHRYHTMHKYRVTALSANILYLDSLGTEGVNLRGCVFYMKTSDLPAYGRNNSHLFHSCTYINQTEIFKMYLILNLNLG